MNDSWDERLEEALVGPLMATVCLESGLFSGWWTLAIIFGVL